ncbi:hypothetical protein ScPMuIL_017028 [Solemya velum]
MGSASSKFRKHLQNGDEVAALNLYNNNSDLRKALDPNCSYGDSHHHETPLLLAARHGMKSLLRIFLVDHGGNPNKTNSHKETCLHTVCIEKNSQYYPVQRRRLNCLELVLKWRGATLRDREVEKVDISAQDEKLNTSLHHAAASGLKRCVELLIHYGAPLFVENAENQTPCDCAEQNGHSDIALYLESKMVFSNDGAVEGVEEEVPVIEGDEFSGLRAQDLQEAKDQLLVETADMLSVPLFTAEALLRNHEWSRQTLLETWMSDPVLCCEKSGVYPPSSLFSEKPEAAESMSSPVPSVSPSPDAVCGICACSFPVSEEPVHMSCFHQFCRECWERYLDFKIQEGDAHHITCPAYKCSKLVPVEIIENVVSRDMARRYLQFDIRAFVDSNPSMKWCPFPRCGRAVKLPELENTSGNNQVPRKRPSDASRAVDCGNGHYFCWDCLGEAHEPCSCPNWNKWHQKVADIKPEQLTGTELETETAANCLWLVTNSKPCPNCKSPIQKNEGCNHMKCSKCKHDFCWVCLDQWRRHNSSTGGYFKCNRYEAVKKVEDQTTNIATEAEAKNTRMQELNRFVHYYTRFKNHENSYKLEEPLLSTAKDKMMKLAEAVTDSTTANAETRFVEDAVHQLLRARRVLKWSYVYGYYLDGPGYKKIVFEFMQTELEECIELLSQMVNRLYLRTPRKKIIEQAHTVQRKRLEFITAIAKGLVPPETPPSLRKHRRRKYSMDLEDEDLKKAIMASIQEVDPTNPWIKDASGRHTNVMALTDWPDSDDSDMEVSSSKLDTQGKCSREGCDRSRAQNPRTGEMHDFCSLRCSRIEHLEESEEMSEVILDEHMDLLRALEMSRLQYLREQGIIGSMPTVPDGSIADTPDSEMSVQSPTGTEGTGEPKGDNSDSNVGKNNMPPMEVLDFEIQRVLELSAISPKELDQELHKGAEALKAEPPRHRVHSQGSSYGRKHNHNSRFDESNWSSIVSRVPNKSVEDLFHDDCMGCRSPQTPHPPVTLSASDGDNLESLGAYGGTATKHVGMFGAIKDLSVSNIHANDDDKTKDFLSKDLIAFYRPKEKSWPKLLAANTPCEEEAIDHVLVSPFSDKSWTDTAGELWEDVEETATPDPVPLASEKTPDPVLSATEETLQIISDVSEDAASPATTNNIEIVDTTRAENISLLEMTENLLQMTSDMQTIIQSRDFNREDLSATPSPGLSNISSIENDLLENNNSNDCDNDCDRSHASGPDDHDTGYFV